MRTVAGIVVVALINVTVFGSTLHAAGAQDTAAPRVLHELVQRGQIGTNLELRARLQDQSDIFEPRAYYRRVGELEYNTVDLTKVARDEWIAVIPAIFVTRDLEYFLEAYDIMGNGPARHGNPDRPHLVKIVTRVETNTANQPRQIQTNVQGQSGQPGVTQRVAADTTPVYKKAWFWGVIVAAAVVAGGAIAAGVYFANKAAADNAPFDNVLVSISGTDPREGL